MAKKLRFLCAFLAAQIILAASAGYFALNLSVPHGTVRGGLAYYGIDFSGLDVSQAASAIKNFNDNAINNGVAVLSFGGTEFTFRFSDIGLAADYTGVEAAVSIKGPAFYLHSLLSAFTRPYGGSPSPRFSADEAAFRKKLNQIKSIIETDPVNADIALAGGTVARSPSASGVYFDVDGRYDAISRAFLSAPYMPFEIDSDAMASSGAVVYTEPLVTDRMLGDVDAVLVTIDADIPNGYDIDKVSEAASAIDKVWVPAKGMASTPFSFLRYFGEADLPMDRPLMEYDLVASALLHALVACGEDYKQMEYAKTGGDGKYAGLPWFDVKLSAGGGSSGGSGGSDSGSNGGSGDGDFMFVNTLDGSIVIFASTEGAVLRITVAGSSKLAGSAVAQSDVYSELDGGRMALYRGGKKIAEYAV